jgi:uncharacterized protein YcfL
MTMTRILSATLLILVVVGCGVQRPARGRADITDHSRIFFSKTYGDQLRDSTAILEERIGYNESGLMTVSIPIRSAVDRSLYLEYQYAFLDEHGRQVEGPLGWTPVTLEAGSPGMIQFTSTTPQSRDYRVTIRFAR